MIGAGAYAKRGLLPALQKAKADLEMVATRSGVSALHASRRFAIRRTSTDALALISDPQVDAVVIATRHASHSQLTQTALRAGKSVFVEKPLAVDHAQLCDIEQAWLASRSLAQPPKLTVGFNRRFAPQIAAIRSALATRNEPANFIMMVNAGSLARDHWSQADEEGGRIIGEACHFVDLLRFLAQSPIRFAQATGGSDTATLQLGFEDGGTGTIHYLANGARSFPKERLEVFCGGSILVLDNFRKLSVHNWRGVQPSRLWKQDKGQQACIAAFLGSLSPEGAPAIPFDDLLEVSRVTIDLADQLR